MSVNILFLGDNDKRKNINSINTMGLPSILPNRKVYTGSSVLMPHIRIRIFAKKASILHNHRYGRKSS